MRTFPSSRTSREGAQRGSAMIVAVIFSAAIALSIGTLFQLSNQSSRLAYRTFYLGAAMNVAETGLEEAMWSVNRQKAGVTGAWNGWTANQDGSMRRTYSLGTISGGGRAEVKVHVSSGTLAGRVEVISRGIITPPSGAPIERWVQVSLERRTLFANGLVAKETITFSGGNAVVDAFDSRRGDYGAALSGGGVNTYDRGSAGSVRVQADSFSLNNSTIWGTAVIGTADMSGLDVGPNGTVGPYGTPVGTIVDNNVQRNFSASFDDVPHPAAVTGSYTVNSISGGLTLPRLTDLPAADGKYYYNVGSIQLSGSGRTASILNITGPVVIRMTTEPGSQAIAVTGNGAIQVNSTALVGLVRPSLEVYTRGDVDIGGNGLINTGVPSQFQLWGTLPDVDSNGDAIDPQEITIRGNGVLRAVVYAPNGEIDMSGGGNSGHVQGAIIGESIEVTGGSRFSYDEALGELNGGEPLGMVRWTEYLTYADRSTQAAKMNF